MLISSSGSNPYSLIETPQFRNDWTRAVANGVIDRQIAAGLLAIVPEMLATAPYRHPLFDAPGQPVDLRWLDLFPGSQNPRVEIWYSIVEDDRLVYLVAVEVIYSNPAGFPDFET